MKIKIVGGTVLNQNPSDPLSGKIIERHSVGMFKVKWCNGTETLEQPEDLILTADIELDIEE